MEEKLKTFLQSGLLERYLVGDLSIAENLEVEYQINNSTLIADAYEQLQINLEIIAKAGAQEAPLNILNNVLNIAEEAQNTPTLPKQKTHWLSIAASISTFFLATSTLFLYLKNQELYSENNVVVEELFDLRNDIDNNNSKLDALALQLRKLNNPDSQKYVLTGNDRAKDLKTVAYINPIEKTSMIDVISLPKLPKDQYYQIRAELEDKMVSLGILDASQRQLKSIPYLEDALALSITIENKNGEIFADDQEVAEISLRKNH
jgi:anti-sigma-K factor RskA